ncbi:hypothetical protein QFC19_006714 [Naganishia cerealis]|uniref:Uncharacterized protein n=1 Tax=Naganishia cerealis TaxID=610337 RepID=A0ACC2VDR4_9TREE|nr:hypothetical protein QFC19_006714 [Naganishia cerealis]
MEPEVSIAIHRETRSIGTSQKSDRQTILRDIRDDMIRRLLRDPVKITAITAGVLVCTGILYGKTFDTTFDTSRFDYSELNRKSAFYFADKRNIFNQYGVKYAWGWTFVVLLLHLLTGPPRVPQSALAPGETVESRHAHQRLSRAHRLLEVVLATLVWALMTQAILAGASLTDLLRRSTGGTCELRLPSSLQEDPNFSSLQTVDAQPIIRTADAGSDSAFAPDLVPSEVYLSLPMQYCSNNIPITPSSHPELYSYLSPKARQEGAEGKITPSQVQGGDLSLRARITQGFDLSGHVFLLVLSTGLILRHISPVLRRWAKKGKVGRGETWIGSTHTGVTILGTALAVLWLWMLWTTSAYFHTTYEKLAGYVAGVSGLIAVLVLSNTASTIIPDVLGPIGYQADGKKVQ